MLRDRKRSSKIVELVDCLTDDADNMLRLVREAPACGSYIKNVQHKEQITLDNLLYKLSKGYPIFLNDHPFDQHNQDNRPLRG